MNRDVVLKRQVTIQGWNVIGGISKASERRELCPILERANEKGETDAKDVAEHLLFSSSREVVAKRLLDIGTSYGLLERNDKKYMLTEKGERAVKTGNVFVPERGAWTIWVSDDPLLPFPVLRIDPFDDSDAVTENRERKKERKERSFEPLPDMIRSVRGKEIAPPASSCGSVVIDELEENAETVDPRESLRLIWSVRDRQLRLLGKWDGKPVDSNLNAPETPPDAVWEALLESEGLSKDWDPEQYALRISFEEADETERESMSRDLTFRKPSVPCFGEFEPLTVPKVALMAGSHDDACKWSAWRLRSRIRDFATSERYDEWRKEAAAPFVQHRPELPVRAELATEEWGSADGRPSPQAWHLVAAEDWGL